MARPDWKSGTYELFGDYLKSQFRTSARFDLQKFLADGFNLQLKRMMRTSTVRRKMKSLIWTLTTMATQFCRLLVT